MSVRLYLRQPILVATPRETIHGFTFTAQEVDHLIAGNKIPAIKSMRIRTGMSLKRAYDLCTDLINKRRNDW